MAGRYRFPLAGGYAIQAHGILDRPSEDVDLFTAWDHRGEFTAAVNAVIDGYREAGYAVDIVRQFETFAQLAVTDPAGPGRPYKVELAANWRSLPPVVMDIGPALHMDDVVAGKMSALFTRAEPRDFLDVDPAIMTSYYTRERLLDPAEEADAGFDRRVFADLLAMPQRYPDRRFAATRQPLITSPPRGNDSRSGGVSWRPTRRSEQATRRDTSCAMQRSAQESGRWPRCRNASSSRSGRTWRR